jgi:molecular chaperone GrpE
MTEKNAQHPLRGKEKHGASHPSDKEHEEPQQIMDDLADFYGFLDNLLPHSSKLLQETLEKHKQALEQKRPKEPHEEKEFLELEKQKNSCLRELLVVAIDQFQRVGADYINFQKRVPRQISDTIAYEKEKIIKSLLPILDNFERTLHNAHSSKNTEAIIKGVQIIYDQMLNTLTLHGVEQIKALGETFDPALHEAVLQKTETEKQDNLVLEESQKGYKLNGHVIRPSKVIVNKQLGHKLQTEVPTLQAEQPEQEASQEGDLQKEQENEEETTDFQ